MFRKKIWYI